LAARARRRAPTMKMRTVSEEEATAILPPSNPPPAKPPSVPPTAATTNLSAASYAAPSFETSDFTLPTTGSRAKRIGAAVAVAADRAPASRRAAASTEAGDSPRPPPPGNAQEDQRHPDGDLISDGTCRKASGTLDRRDG